MAKFMVPAFVLVEAASVKEAEGQVAVLQAAGVELGLHMYLTLETKEVDPSQQADAEAIMARFQLVPSSVLAK